MPPNRSDKSGDAGVAAVQQFPVPASWKSLAENFVASQFDRLAPNQQQRIVAASASAKELYDLKIAHYSDQTFRQLFYHVIGHQYVLALLRIAKLEGDTPISNEEWASKLGVNRSTIHRWKRYLVTAGAENFFAIQLLIMNKSVRELTLPPNNDMLRESVMSMLREIQTTISRPSHSVLTPTVFCAIFESMRAMTFASVPKYVPIGSESARDSNEALKALTKHLRNYEPKMFGRIQPSVLQTWLDDWGLAYSVFGISYQPDWKGARFQS